MPLGSAGPAIIRCRVRQECPPAAPSVLSCSRGPRLMCGRSSHYFARPSRGTAKSLPARAPISCCPFCLSPLPEEQIPCPHRRTSTGVPTATSTPTHLNGSMWSASRRLYARFARAFSRLFASPAAPSGTPLRASSHETVAPDRRLLYLCHDCLYLTRDPERYYNDCGSNPICPACGGENIHYEGEHPCASKAPSTTARSA